MGLVVQMDLEVQAVQKVRYHQVVLVAQGVLEDLKGLVAQMVPLHLEDLGNQEDQWDQVAL